MRRSDSFAWRGVLPLGAVSAAVVLVAFGLGRGVWTANLHNGLLALALTSVGAYVALQRPGHREATLFLAAGLVEGVMFLGRQVGHDPAGRADSADRWLGWLGVWPLAAGLALTTLAIVSFPDGRLPSRRWRPIVAGVVALAALCSCLSALWPVEYASSGVLTPHPFSRSTPELATAAWNALAHSSYAAFQVLWLVAVVARWRTADARVRRQLRWLAAAALVSMVALAAGLVVAGTHIPGVLAATLLPVGAGWAIVHEQHVTAYEALSWLSRAGATSDDLPAAVAATAAEAFSAPGATLWMGPHDELHPIGVWPATTDAVGTRTTEGLRADGGEVREIVRDGDVAGALSVEARRAGPLTLAEHRLLDDLAGQAAWVVGHVGLARAIGQERAAGHLVHLTPRENDVLELLARGHTNRAICDELHLSVKTVEPIIGAIFDKLELHADPGTNRRVLAVLAYLRARSDDARTPA